MHASHETCKEAAAPVLFQLAAHSMRVRRTKARPYGDAKLQASHSAAHDFSTVSPLCVAFCSVLVIARTCSEGKGDVCRWTKCCCVKFSHLHSSRAQVVMTARISPVVCHHCCVDSRDGSRLRSVSALPLDNIVVSLWPSLSP